jgi:sialate O-acetylesterase
MYKKYLLLVVALVSAQVSALAEVRLPNFFGDHMVLQRDKPIPVWGWADPGERVSVVLTHENSKAKPVTVKAGSDGKWRVNLPATEAGGPYQLIVKGKKSEVLVQDVLIGEVWICSGQSNMAWSVNQSRNADVEKAGANFPAIRHITIPRVISLTEEEDIKKTPWLVTTPETVGGFSAVAYFFARDLYNELNIPIGLINTSWGGTQVESWISREGVDSFDEFSGITSNLPSNIEELNERRKKLLLDKITAAQGAFPDATMASGFSKEGFDDSAWKTFRLPGYYDAQELPHFDGVIWFRKTIEDATIQPGKPAFLSLGFSDDTEEVFVNGTKIGGSRDASTLAKHYLLPAGALKSGKNTLAIRVQDKGGRGGFYGREDQFALIQEGNQVSLEGPWKYRVESLTDNKQFAGPNNAATLLYNSMIAPLVPFGIKGAIWYQGESNASRAVQYRKSFPLMISDWRKKWGEDFPFYFVQLASFKAFDGTSQTGSTWAELREAQTLSLKLPNTGMAVIHDIGERDDIHPVNKQDVGKRLALSALSSLYGKAIVHSGPVYKSMAKEGNAISLTFDHVGGGLVVKGDKYGYLKGFEIAGADQKFYPAKAEISGSKVVVWSDDVSAPVAVRYGWADDNIEANLFNAEGLPANSFRTDDWKPFTADVKFK